MTDRKPAKKPVGERPSARAYEQEIKALRHEVLSLRAERDETDNLVAYLRQRMIALNVEVRVARARGQELEQATGFSAPLGVVD